MPLAQVVWSNGKALNANFGCVPYESESKHWLSCLRYVVFGQYIQGNDWIVPRLPTNFPINVSSEVSTRYTRSSDIDSTSPTHKKSDMAKYFANSVRKEIGIFISRIQIIIWRKTDCVLEWIEEVLNQTVKPGEKYRRVMTTPQKKSGMNNYLCCETWLYVLIRTERERERRSNKGCIVMFRLW
jgi:hypothetical protein